MLYTLLAVVNYITDLNKQLTNYWNSQAI